MNRDELIALIDERIEAKIVAVLDGLSAASLYRRDSIGEYLKGACEAQDRLAAIGVVEAGSPASLAHGGAGDGGQS